MAKLALEEEEWWGAEMARLAPQLLLTGRPVRGGGRAALDEEAIALDVIRVGEIPGAVQRRLLRYAAKRLGVALGFEATESLREMVSSGRAGQQLTLPGGLTAERTARELRLRQGGRTEGNAKLTSVELPVPGEAVAFGWRFQARSSIAGVPAVIRAWRPGDRVTLRYSSGPRKIKEVLERMRVNGSERVEWPVVEWQGKIVWMRGAELQPVPEAAFSAERTEPLTGPPPKL
jgi:tRNA(Ile)-lysidine synthase